MKLAANWSHILRRAWSIRLMILAGLLSGVEVILPMFPDCCPRGVFAGLSLVIIAGAFVARLAAQKGFD